MWQTTTQHKQQQFQYQIVVLEWIGVLYVRPDTADSFPSGKSLYVEFPFPFSSSIPPFGISTKHLKVKKKTRGNWPQGTTLPDGPFAAQGIVVLCLDCLHWQ